MEKLLRRLWKEGRRLSLYSNRGEPDKFDFGRLLCVSDAWYALECVCLSGEYDGVIVDSIKNVRRVECDGQYDEKMRKLCADEAFGSFEGTLEEARLRESLLDVAARTREVVSIELQGNDSDSFDSVGIVEKLEDGLCKLLEVDCYGYADGESYFRVEDVSMILYAGASERRRRRLWEINQRAQAN